jgi:hypothetical protein
MPPTELAPPIQCPTACPAAHSNGVFCIKYTCLPNIQPFRHNRTAAEKVEKTRLDAPLAWLKISSRNDESFSRCL